MLRAGVRGRVYLKVRAPWAMEQPGLGEQGHDQGC